MSEQFNPFQSPKLAPPAAPTQRAMSWIMPFESGNARAKWTMALLGLTAMLNIAGAANGYTRYNFFAERPLPTLEETRDVLTSVIAGVQFLVAVGAIIAFSLWTHRATRNLPALGGRGLRFTPGWAVGWFFIPLANFVMPYLVFAEIWRHSDPQQRNLDGSGDKKTSPLVGCWWGANVTRLFIEYGLTPLLFIPYMAAVFPAAAAGPHSSQMEKVLGEYLPRFCILGIAANAAEFVAAILAILVVRRIDINEQAKYELILNEPTRI